MSLNTGINAVIALLENRPTHFREMLRSDSEVIDVSETCARLYKALDLVIAKELRSILKDCLRIQPTEGFDFFSGVRAVESLFEKRIEVLEQ